MTAAGAAPTRVLVIAPYPALRAGLIALLSSDPTLAPLAPEGIDLAGADEAPAAIVADFSAGEPEELAAIEELYPNIPLVYVGADIAADGPGLASSPVAYVASDVDGAGLAAAVHAVASGLIVLDAATVSAAGIHTHTRPSPEGEPLTAREREVLFLVAEGLPNKAIARELGISEHTAKFHVGSLLGKLGAASRTEAVTLATRRGILPV